MTVRSRWLVVLTLGLALSTMMPSWTQDLETGQEGSAPDTVAAAAPETGGAAGGTPGVVSLSYSDLDFRDLIKVVAKDAQTDAIVEKAVRKKVAVECSGAPAMPLLERLAEEQGLRTCQVGAVTLFYEFPFTGFRVYRGPDDYEDTLPTAVQTYLDRVSEGAGKRISVSRADTDIHQVFAEIAAGAGCGYRAAGSFAGNVWVDFSDVPAGDAFVALAVANGLGVQAEGGTWIVGKPEAFGSSGD